MQTWMKTNRTFSSLTAGSFIEAKSCFYSDQDLIDTVIRLKSGISQQRDVMYAYDRYYDDQSHEYGDWQSSDYGRWQPHDDDDWQEPSSEHLQDHEDHQRESSDANEYPDDPDDIQDSNVCLAYEDGYPNYGYFEDQRIWDDRYK